MTILVLGGSGFIGSHVVNELVKDKNSVLSYDITQYNTPSGVKFIKADMLSPLSLESVFFENDIDTVIHLIGLPDINLCQKDPQSSFYLNVLSLQNTLEPMRKADIGRIIFASSAAVYGYPSRAPVDEESELSPNTVYGCHKLIGEELVKSYADLYGIESIILRLFNVYGADPSVGKDVISIFIRKAKAHESITVKGPNKFRDFVHVDDVAKVFTELTASNESCILNVGTGDKTALSDITDVMRFSFPDLIVHEESDPEDGTGICADNKALLSRLKNVSLRLPLVGIEAHVRRFAS